MGAYAASTQWDIFYIDPKGERAIAERFYSMMRQSGRSCAVFPDQIYNGWQGSTNALVDRIMALAAFAEDGAAAYYSEAAEVIIRAAVLAHGRPPATFEELEERLRYPSLLKAHKDDPVTLARIESAGEMNVASAHMRIANMTSKLSRIKAGGWTIDTLQSGIWSVPVMGNKRDSAAISRFVLSDIEDYFSNRKDPSKRVVVVIDEFSSLGNDAVIRLMEVVRSLGGIIILAAQTVEGLGTPEQAARILGNVTTICHRMSDASAIIHRAGTARRLETSYQMQGTIKLKPTGQGHARMVEGDKVQLTDVQTLGVGAAWVIARGRAALIQVAPASPLTMLPLPAREGEAAAPPVKRTPPPGSEEVAPGVYRRPWPTLAEPPAAAAASQPPTDPAAPAGDPATKPGADPVEPKDAAPDRAPRATDSAPAESLQGTTEEPAEYDEKGATDDTPPAEPGGSTF